MHTYKTGSAMFIYDPDLSGVVTIRTELGVVAIEGCDLIDFIENRHGSDEDESRSFEDTINNIARLVPADIRSRFKKFSFDYFMLVSPFSHEMQEKFLNRAEELHWSIFELAAEIKLFRYGPPENEE